MSRQNKSYKTEDGTIWHSRSVAVVGVVMAIIGAETYVLLTKRSLDMEDMPGRWCLPCGYLDWDETLIEAVEREILEETTLNLKDYRQNLTINFPASRVNSNVESNRQNVSITSVYVLEGLKELPKVEVTIETSEVEWCLAYPDELREKDLVFDHFAVIKDSVNKILKYKD